MTGAKTNLVLFEEGQGAQALELRHDELLGAVQLQLAMDVVENERTNGALLVARCLQRTAQTYILKVNRKISKCKKFQFIEQCTSDHDHMKHNSQDLFSRENTKIGAHYRQVLVRSVLLTRNCKVRLS